MTSGRKRKERRRARQAEAARDAKSQTPPDAGTGARGESGLTATEEAKLVARSIREGWGTPRWPTRSAISELQATPHSTPIEKTVLTVVKLLEGNDRAKGIAARTIVAMEAQNQSDEHLQASLDRGKKDADPVPINVSVTLSVQSAIDRVKLLPREERAKLLESAKLLRQLRESKEQ